jgi:hypothetical protein
LTLHVRETSLGRWWEGGKSRHFKLDSRNEKRYQESRPEEGIGTERIVGAGRRDIPDMGNIVKLSSDIMQQLRPSEPMSGLDLRTEMTKDNDSWHFRSDKDRSD